MSRLWSRDGGIVACNGGLVYGPTPPPACACLGAVGACCINGVCSQKSVSDCFSDGGVFRGGPCLPDLCFSPSCCGPLAPCFHPATPGVLAWSVTFRGTGCAGVGGGFPFNQTASGSEPRGAAIDCGYGLKFGVASGVVCSNFTINAQVRFLVSTTDTTISLPTFRVSLEIAGQGEVAHAYVPASCGGGSFSVQFPAVGDWTNLSVSGSASVPLGVRCDGVPEVGACCYPDLSCLQLPETYRSVCINSGGRWLGIGTSCVPNPCIGENGSCCLPDGRCVENVTEEKCRELAMSDPFGRLPTHILGGGCDDCFGACCLPNGGCFNTNKSACLASGGVFRRVFPAVSNPCGSVQCSDPPPPCCGGSSCASCYIPGSSGALYPAFINVDLSASLWHLPTGTANCVQIDALAGSQSAQSLVIDGPASCGYETDSASVTLFSPPGVAPPLSAAAQFKACDGVRGPHIVINAAGIITRHDVDCSGGTVIVSRPDFGAPCGSSRNWRNIQVTVTATISVAASCGNARSDSVANPVFYRSSGGCAGCGGGTKGLTV